MSAISQPVAFSRGPLSVRLQPRPENSYGLASVMLSYAKHVDLGGGVKHINAYTYFILGEFVHDLMVVENNIHANHEVVTVLVHARDNLKMFRENHDPEIFRSSCAAATELERLVDSTLLNIMDIERQNRSPIFGSEHESAFRVAVMHFHAMLAKELSDWPLFCVQDKGAYSTSKLIKGCARYLPQDVKSKLTPATVDEINEAGKCLAFSRSTATGFHILRAVELLILELIGKLQLTPPPAKNRNWGEYIHILRTGNVAKEITDLLQGIKENYRNPIMHPDDRLDLQEALSLFGICLSGLEVICRHIP